MKTRNSFSRWSELLVDILRSVLERLSFADFHRAKIVCTNWYLCSKQSVRPKIRSPLLILFLENGCVLYNPEEDRDYKPKRDLSGFRFLANSCKWFVVVDSQLNLYIIDVFSEKKIDLSPLDSIKVADYNLERVGDKELVEKFYDTGQPCGCRTGEELRGVLWVNEDKEELEYLVVWHFNISRYIGYCKNGYDHYLGIRTKTGFDRDSIRWNLKGVNDMVLKGELLYILSRSVFIRILDLSRQVGFKDVSDSHIHSMHPPALIERETTTKIVSDGENIAVKTSGDALMVCNCVYEDSASIRHRIFRLFRRDPDQDPNRYKPLDEVVSLGDEALFHDSGITVPVDKTLGIEPNSIYFTRGNRVLCKTGLWIQKRGCKNNCK